MDYDFFGAFTPRIIDVVKRDATFFDSFDYVLQKGKTKRMEQLARSMNNN